MSELTCERVDELSAAFALDALDADEAQALIGHARSCRTSAHAELAEALALRDAILVAPEPVEPSVGLRERIMASAAVTAQEGAAETPVRAAPGAADPPPSPIAADQPVAVGRPRPRLGFALAFAATSVAAIVLMSLFSLDLASRIAEQDRLLDRVAEALAAGGAATRVDSQHGQGYLIRRDGQVTLIVSNVPETPVGSLYEMWLIPADGAPQPAGTFMSDGRGVIVATATGDAAAGQTFAVTIEQSVVDQPTSEPVIAVSVPDQRQ